MIQHCKAEAPGA